MDKQQIGKLIIELRKQNNMRQKELAEKMCVSASAVSKWESGTNLPDTATLIALTEIFHISENAFLHPEETLNQLESEKSYIPTATPITESITTTLRNTRPHSSMVGYACAFVLLFILILGSLGVYRYLNPSFTVITSRYMEYDVHGVVFELSVVCPTYTTQDAIHEYADHLFEEWIDGAYASDADAVRIEFYTDAEAASRWTFDTINSITLIK